MCSLQKRDLDKEVINHHKILGQNKIICHKGSVDQSFAELKTEANNWSAQD